MTLPFNLGDLFDRAGRLRPLGELPPEVQAEIASFEVVRFRIRRNGETEMPEGLIGVKARAGGPRTARSDAPSWCA
jgi:hypothetical protein